MTLKNISFCIPIDGVRGKDMFLTKVRFFIHCTNFSKHGDCLNI